MDDSVGTSAIAAASGAVSSPHACCAAELAEIRRE
jgi:hypothetical protein